MHPWLNPRVKTTGVRWWHINLTVVIAIVAVILAFVLGLFVGSTVTRNTAYYHAHYQAPLKVPHVYQRVHVSKSVRANATDAGSIHFAFFTTQTNDQGTMGSCEAWAFDKSISYAANWNRQPNGGHWHRFYSARFGYDNVSPGCVDGGSYLEQYPPMVEALGIPQWKEMPYGTAAESLPSPLPAFALDCPTPQWALTLAKLHSLGITETVLFPNQGAGVGGLALIHQQLDTHHAVAVDLPVFSGYDKANSDGSTVNLPALGETDRGGHANVDVRSDPTHNNGNGTYGGDLFSNQWSKYAGVGADGIRHTGPYNGYVWVSWAFIEQYVWDAAVIHVSASSPGAKSLPAPPNTPADGGKPPFVPAASIQQNPKKVATSGWYVKPFYTRDTGQNISPIINATGDRYHIWPVYILAVVLAESNGFTGYQSERFKLWPDWSCGLMQQIIANVTAHTGITDTRTACNWEENPVNSIQYGTQLLREYMDRTGVGYPALWQCYNAGPGSCRSPYYAGFLSNYYVALGYATNQPGPAPTPPPPPPTPRQHFPHAKWCHWTAAHHRPCPSPKWHGRLGTVAREWAFNKKSFGKNAHPRSVCRGTLGREQYNAQRHVMKTPFAGCTVFSWPRFRHDPTLWYRGRR